MLRQTIAKLLGFDAEIASLRRRIEELSWDKTFGMWTREAFLQFCAIMPRGERLVAFLDFDDIHRMNQIYGYGEVDRRVRATFGIPFRRSDIVARWYSGDEIVILFDAPRPGAEYKLGELAEAAWQNGLTFQYDLGVWHVGQQTIQEVIDGLSVQNQRRKTLMRCMSNALTADTVPLRVLSPASESLS